MEYANTRIYERVHKADDRIIAKPTKKMLQSLKIDPSLLPELEAVYLAHGIYEKQSNQQAKRQQLALWMFEHLERSLHCFSSSTLPEWNLGKQFQEAYAHSIVSNAQNETTQLTRKQFSERIGCSTRNLNNVLNRASIHSEIQFDYQKIKTSDGIHEQARKANKRLKGFTKTVLSENSNGDMKEIRYHVQDTALTQWIDTEIHAGNTVSLKLQVANMQTIASDAPTLAPTKLTPNLSDSAIERKMIEAMHKIDRPAKPKHFGKDYDPVWMFEQFAMAMSRIEAFSSWRVDEQYIVDTDTGEIYLKNPTANDLFNILIGEMKFDTVEQVDPLFLDGIMLGGVLKPLDSTEGLFANQSL